MRLEIGDSIYCYKLVDKVGKGLTLDKRYKVVNTRPKDRWCRLTMIHIETPANPTNALIDIEMCNWWFGQIGGTECWKCWTNWFISEKEWLRNNKLNELGI